MSTQQVQVIRRSSTSWSVQRVGLLWENVWEYETVAQIVYEDGLYYAEVDSVRLPRGYQLLRGAVRAALDHGQSLPQ